MLMRGFSLLEMLIALMLSSLILLGAVAFLPSLQIQILTMHQSYRLEQAMRGGLSGLVKDVRRAGFIASDVTPSALSPLTVNPAKNCIIIRYDLDRTGHWEYYPGDAKNSDIFAYRFYKNNLEYRSGVPSCIGAGWEKVLDAAEVKLIAFSIEQSQHYLVVYMQAAMKKNMRIMLALTQVIKHENI